MGSLLAVAAAERADGALLESDSRARQGSRSSGNEREWTEVKLLPAGAGAADHVGEVVAIEGDRLIVTSDNLDEPSGAVYVFDRIRGVWTQTAKITSSDVVPDDGSFGSSAALGGDTIVVSAPFQDGEGVEHVFERVGGAVGWRAAKELRSPDGKATKFAGSAVQGETLLVGSIFDDDMAPDAGAIYVFGRDVGGEDNWGPEAKLYVSDAGQTDYSGSPNAIDGDILVVAAGQDDDQGQNAGAVYVFDRHPVDGSWHEVAKLVAADAQDGDRFGYSLGLSRDTTIVGVDERDSEVGNNTGVVYVFERDHGGPDQWGEAARLTASDMAHGDGLGHAVGIDGNLLAASGPTADGRVEDAGTVWLFERDADSGKWREVARLFASDGEAVDSFGQAVAVSGGTVVVGAPSDDDAGFNAGAVYVYQLQPLLTVAGTCPGTIEIEVADATPGTPVMLLGAESEGTDTVPVGPCQGAEVDLVAPRVVGTLTADDEGRIAVSRSVGPGACGRVLQALEGWTCRVSTTAGVPGG